MPEYKRLISYIYSYEKGIKRNNVGFAKIELRNGQCKFSINIKAASLNGQKLRTYAFYRENKKMIQILLAESFVKNGVFEWKGITNASNIMNTGHDFNQLGGVLLYFSLDKYYATEWDDQPVLLNRLYEWADMDSWKEDIQEPVQEVEQEAICETVRETAQEVKEPRFIEVPKEEITYIEQKQEAEEAISKNQEEIVQSILKSIDCSWELFCNLQDDTDSQLKSNSRKKAKQGLKVAEFSGESKDNIISAEAAKLVGYRFIDWYRGRETGFPKDDRSVKVTSVVNEFIDTDQSVDEKVDTQEDTQVELVELEESSEEESSEYVLSEDELNAERLIQDISNIEASDIEQEDNKAREETAASALFKEEQSYYSAKTEKEWNDRLDEVAKKKTTTAERILQKYPAIYPFDDDEIVSCVRIEPGDIGLFPIENWVLGNNSFLLHGYYNFRHLIFAKKKAIDGEEYILGIPGIFQNREKFMAKMFGFTEFKSAKNVEQKTGEFGYWYIKINM